MRALPLLSEVWMRAFLSEEDVTAGRGDPQYTQPAMPRFSWCVLALGLGLLAVGVVSGTPVRHLVQAAPAALVVALARRRVAWAADAALPVLAAWLLVMAAIWLYLLGLARILSGRFSNVEIALTLVIGAASLAGLAVAARASTATTRARVVAIVGFALLQLACLWASMRMPLAKM